MTKYELVGALARKGNCSRKNAEWALDLVSEVLSETLASGEKVHLPGFGTFELHERKEKNASNPRTHKPMRTPARKAPVFRAAKALKEAVNRAWPPEES